jgi:hypothetical protein
MSAPSPILSVTRYFWPESIGAFSSRLNALVSQR